MWWLGVCMAVRLMAWLRVSMVAYLRFLVAVRMVVCWLFGMRVMSRRFTAGGIVSVRVMVVVVANVTVFDVMSALARAAS